MCGIARYFDPRNISDKVILNTRSLMQNRGPDAKKIYKSKCIIILNKK